MFILSVGILVFMLILVVLLLNAVRKRKEEMLSFSQPTMEVDFFTVRDEIRDMIAPLIINIISGLFLVAYDLVYISIWRYIVIGVGVIFIVSFIVTVDRTTWYAEVYNDEMRIYFHLPQFFFKKTVRIVSHDVIRGEFKPNGAIVLIDKTHYLFTVERTHIAYDLMVRWLKRKEEWEDFSFNVEKNIT